MTIGSTGSSEASLARALARSALAVDLGRFDADVIAKAKICLLDFLSCAFEARNHPWSRQAIDIAREVRDGATIIGNRTLASPGDAAFANAVMGHGLVREDMHAASICHHGVVIWPTLLALSERAPLSGATSFLAAAIIGYETGAQIGRALFNADLARLYRPTGLVAPLGAALAGSFALGLTEDAATSAMAIAANTSSGLNEWPRAGGSEMYFHPGFAARNAIAAIELAEAGARGFRNDPRGRGRTVRRLPPPARPWRKSSCLPAQSRRSWPSTTNRHRPVILLRPPRRPPCAPRANSDPRKTSPTISIRVPEAAARYPGCDSKGPFHNALQAKMSIPFSVAAVLARGALEEENYADIGDIRILGLVERIDLQTAPDFTAAFPASQGAEVIGRAAQRHDDPAAPRQRHRRHARRNPRPLPTGGFRRDRRPRAATWKSWSMIAHRCRTAASSPRGAGLNRPNRDCGQHHDRRATNQNWGKRCSSRKRPREVRGDRRRWKVFCRRCPPAS